MAKKTADILLDSDVIIEVLRGNPSIVLKLTRLEHASHALCYTPIARAEIYHGVRNEEEEATRNFFSVMRPLLITDEVGELAGRYLASFHKSHSLELADALVAAAASIYKATLFTLNRKHYPMKDIHFL